MKACVDLICEHGINWRISKYPCEDCRYPAFYKELLKDYSELKRLYTKNREQEISKNTTVNIVKTKLDRVTQELIQSLTDKEFKYIFRD